MHKSLHSLQLFLAVQLARKGWENAFFDEQLVLQPINKLQSYFFCLHQSSCITGFPVAARKQFSSLTFSTDSAAIAIEFPAIVNPIGREEDKEGVTRIPCFGSESNALFQLLRALNPESRKGPIILLNQNKLLRMIRVRARSSFRHLRLLASSRNIPLSYMSRLLATPFFTPK